MIFLPAETSTENLGIIRLILGPYGFYLEHTGRYSSAFIRRLPDGTETWISDGDANVPSYWAQEVMIWEGTQQDADAVRGEFAEGFTLAEVLAALNHPDDTINSLIDRLHKKLHRATWVELARGVA